MDEARGDGNGIAGTVELVFQCVLAGALDYFQYSGEHIDGLLLNIVILQAAAMARPHGELFDHIFIVDFNDFLAAPGFFNDFIFAHDRSVQILYWLYSG